MACCMIDIIVCSGPTAIAAHEAGCYTAFDVRSYVARVDSPVGYSRVEEHDAGGAFAGARPASPASGLRHHATFAVFLINRDDNDPQSLRSTQRGSLSDRIVDLARATGSLILAAGERGGGCADLRLYGINWDANNHLHPDEREIVFKSMCLSFPGTPRIGNCDPAYTGPGWLLSPNSPLNPHFFAYGSIPTLSAGGCLPWAGLAHTSHRRTLLPPRWWLLG